MIFLKGVIFANHKNNELMYLNKPKALARVMGKTLLEYNCELLGKCADEIIVVCSAETENCLEKEGISFCREEEFFGNQQKILNDVTLFADGGSLYFMDIEAFVSFHCKNKNKITLAASESIENELLPVVSKKKDELWKFNNMYILEKETLGCDVKNLLKENAVSVYCSKEKFVFVNNVWDLMKVSFELINKTRLPVPLSASVDESAFVSSKAYIGENCRIGKFAKIGAYCVVEDNCVIKDSAELKYTTVGEGSLIGKNTEIEFSFLMENSKIGDRCILRGGNVVEKNFEVSNDSVIQENLPLCESTFNETKKNEKISEKDKKILR